MSDLLMVKKTQLELIRDRGYDITEEEWLLNDIEDKNYRKKFKKLTLNQKYQKDMVAKESIYVLYLMPGDGLATVMKAFKKEMVGIKSGIIIGDPDQLKKLNQGGYEEYLDPLKQIQFFQYDTLTYNVSKHILSPSYIAIDKSLIMPSLVQLNQLSVMYANDPAVKYYGWLPGQVVKVIDDNIYTDLLPDYLINYCIVSSKMLK